MARGFVEALAFINAVPKEAEAKLGELLTEFGLEISAAQKNAVAEDTGYLKRGLSFDVLLEELRVQIGLLKFRSGRNSRYYGRFVEFGRRAQTVRVVRGTAKSKKSYTSRKAREAGKKLRDSYPLKVKAIASRPFVNLPDTEFRVDKRIAQFWSEAIPE